MRDAVFTERLACRAPEPNDEAHYAALTGSAEVGSWRRLATEAAMVAIGVARRRSFPRLVAFALIDNVASRRVMENAGMRLVGDIEHAGLPHVLYELDLGRR